MDCKNDFCPTPQETCGDKTCGVWDLKEDCRCFDCAKCFPDPTKGTLAIKINADGSDSYYCISLE